MSPKPGLTKNPGKQRKRVANAPLHVKGSFLGSHLSKDLRSKLKRRTLRVRTGDKVSIMRGNFAGFVGVVERVDLQNCNVFVAGVDRTKRDGSKARPGVHPSKIMIQELNATDKRRLL